MRVGISIGDPDPRVFGPPGSGSISHRNGSGDPDTDPHQNVTDPQHWLVPYWTAEFNKKKIKIEKLKG